MFYLKYIMLCQNSITLCHPKVACNINNIMILFSSLAYYRSRSHEWFKCGILLPDCVNHYFHCALAKNKNIY